MKKGAQIVLGLILCWSASSAQESIHNPDKPSSPAAYRTINLREVARFTDEGGEFYLKSPGLVKKAPDGSYYILDREQLIHLDAQGKFLGNLFRKGQGPGELNFSSSFAFDGDDVIVQGHSPEKLVWFDNRGNCIRDVSLSGTGGNVSMVHYERGVFYGFHLRFSHADKGGLGTQDNVLLSISADGKTVKELAAFPVRILRQDGAFLFDGTESATLSGRFIAVSHTMDYKIKLFDIQAPGALRAFDRKYKRVAASDDAPGVAIIRVNGTRVYLPGSEWARDIVKLYSYKDVLWVKTSTRDKNKRILYDVFSLEGRYIDAFFMDPSRRLINVQGDILFSHETTPDETIDIVAYKVVD